MPFRWFKRHEKRLMFFIVIVIVPTLGASVAATMFFSDIGRAKDVTAHFELVPGERTTVGVRELQKDARLFGSGNIASLVERRAYLKEAELAGVWVSDREVGDRISNILRASVFPTGYTMEQYKKYVNTAYGVSPKQYETGVREDMIISRLFSLKRSGRRVLSKDVYDAYSLDNNILEFEYVAFHAEDYKKEFHPTDFEAEEVTEFYTRIKENEVEYSWAIDEYRIPEKYTIEVVTLGFEDADPESHGDLLNPEEAPTEDDLRAYYEDHLDWFRPAESETDSEDSEEPVEESEDEAPDETLAEPTPFEEVREEIRTRYLVQRGFERYYDELVLRKANGEEVNLAEYAAEKGLNHIRLEDLDLEALEADENIGHRLIGSEIVGLEAGEYAESVGTGKKESVYLIRSVSTKPAAFKEQKQVEGALRQDLIEEKSRIRVQEAARDFHDEMESWIEAQVKADRGDPEEEEEPEESGDEASEDEEEEKKPEELTPEEKVALAELQTAKRERLHEAFDELTKEKGHEVKSMGPARFLKAGSEELEAETDPDRRFLLSNFRVKTLVDDQVEGRNIVDRDRWVSYVVKMVKKGKPDPSEMTSEDFDNYRQRKMIQGFQMMQRTTEFERNRFLQEIKLSPRAGGGTPLPPTP